MRILLTLAFSIMLPLGVMAAGGGDGGGSGGGSDGGGAGGSGGGGSAGGANGDADGGGTEGKTGTLWVNPPEKTENTTICQHVTIWDTASETCQAPTFASFDTQTLYHAVRELAYAGRYRDAQSILQVMHDQTDDRVLTYWGFTHRKLGHRELADAYYRSAIAINPDNILARSYMGQGFVAEGKLDLAIAQWREINVRGGQGTWAESSLREAIRTGVTYSY
ncbi:hypothetical protein [Tropicibacter sp. Alg240-R139]|uniref:tetratricopeptide repeat protein n=1 Tax=Tropicibacter sp. Alg240-R139 TaxID=2305991 RepID=UPI001F086C94|nr:hypothetical protein [Tropicibacter sp. Alg240-R139]